MKSLRCALFLVVLLSLAPSFTYAENAEIISKTSPAQLEEILKSRGYSANLDDDGNVRWMIEGVTSYVFVTKNGDSLIFSTLVSDYLAPLDFLNEWNRDKVFSKTYITSSNKTALALELELAGGVTRERLENFFNTCKISLQTWMAELAKVAKANGATKG